MQIQICAETSLICTDFVFACVDIQPPSATLSSSDHANHMLIQISPRKGDKMSVAYREVESAETFMAGHDAGRQVSGFSCSRVKNSKSKENFGAGDENGK